MMTAPWNESVKRMFCIRIYHVYHIYFTINESIRFQLQLIQTRTQAPPIMSITHTANNCMPNCWSYWIMIMFCVFFFFKLFVKSCAAGRQTALSLMSECISSPSLFQAILAGFNLKRKNFDCNCDQEKI